MRRTKKLRTKKFRGGGMDASSSDFKTPSATPGASRGPAGGASAGGNYGGNRNPAQTYGGSSNRERGIRKAQAEAGKTTNYPTRLQATKIALDKRTKLDNKLDPNKFKLNKGMFSTTAEPTDVPYKSNMLVNLAASALVPGGGAVAELGQRAKYRDRQKFARNEGLYKDFYRGTQYTTGKTLQPNSPEGKEFLKDAGYGKRPPEQKKDDNDVKCPPGFINQGGVCVKQSTTPAPTQTAAPSGPGLKPFYRFDAQGNVVSVKEGGEIEFTKSIQSDYYKDLL